MRTGNRCRIGPLRMNSYARNDAKVAIIEPDPTRKILDNGLQEGRAFAQELVVLLQFGLERLAFGYIVMGCNPSAVGHRLVSDLKGLSIQQLNDSGRYTAVDRHTVAPGVVCFR